MLNVMKIVVEWSPDPEAVFLLLLPLLLAQAAGYLGTKRPSIVPVLVALTTGVFAARGLGFIVVGAYLLFVTASAALGELHDSTLSGRWPWLWRYRYLLGSAASIVALLEKRSEFFGNYSTALLLSAVLLGFAEGARRPGSEQSGRRDGAMLALLAFGYPIAVHAVSLVVQSFVLPGHMASWLGGVFEGRDLQYSVVVVLAAVLWRLPASWQRGTGRTLLVAAVGGLVVAGPWAVAFTTFVETPIDRYAFAFLFESFLLGFFVSLASHRVERLTRRLLNKPAGGGLVEASLFCFVAGTGLGLLSAVASFPFRGSITWPVFFLSWE
jgi:hypothetical protein